MEILEKYRILNNSFKKKLVFNLGVDAGFFSEINNMVLAMLYCLDQKISISLYSSNANFKVEKGWDDYFISFCTEDINFNHSKFNRRMPVNRSIQHENLIYKIFINNFVNRGKNVVDLIKESFVKQLYFNSTGRFNYFTHDLWDSFRNFKFQKHWFNIPELGIDGDIQHASAILIKMIWNYNEKTKIEIVSATSDIKLPDEYIGFHIRRGDKFIEYEVQELNTYIEKAEALSSLRTAFVLTDDYIIFRELKKNIQPGLFILFVLKVVWGIITRLSVIWMLTSSVNNIFDFLRL